MSYGQRGSLQIPIHTLEAICELFPTFRRLRMLRNWAGIVDVTPDRSPIIGLTSVPGLYLNCGWGTGGYNLFSSLHRGGAVGTFIFAIGAVQTHPNWAISTPIAIVGAVVIWIIGRAAAMFWQVG